jgi:tetratricopeptide (TPR) repeat protein/tRNA A-37 threonylcarbamoyl transferase component Bud32
MNPERWQRIGDLFEEALALPANERSAMVDRVAASDRQVREEVLSLLASHHAVPGGFVQKRIQFAVESFHRTSAAAETPARVGPYRLIRELGRGGMGAVFLAERDDEEYRAKVAIKLVRSGMDTAFILSRFRRERQTLARLQHPNISRLLDGGTTDEGLPYIVMEYIDGPWITAYAARQQLGVEARVRLFQEVCSAVDYAHRSFIVHRDLKPGNVLVDGAGVPKLVDFGICKLLVDSVTGDDTVGPPMTPNYASPEQLRGEAATTSSDIYSLGVVLYELLTGSCPRRFESLTPRAIERALERPLERASVMVAEPRLARQIAGDLDTILMRALDPDPGQRYDSAAQFADDLRRHLEHLPIRARPHTLRYRAATFVRRHRGSTTAAAAIFAALALGLAVSRQQARLADERLGQVRSLASKLVVDVDDAVRDLPGSTRARQMIVQTGLTYLDELVRSAGRDPQALTELARAYRRLGDVQGNVDSANLGDLPSALAMYDKALPLLEEATRLAPDDIDARTEQLVVRSRIAALHAETGKLRDALQNFQDAIARAAVPAPSSDRAFRLALADAYQGAGNARRNLGDDQGAFDAASACLRLYREAAETDRSNTVVLRGMAGALGAVGMAQSRLGQLEPALASFREGATTLEHLVKADPHNLNWNRELMLAYGHIADVLGNPDLQNLGDRAGALAAYRQAAEAGKRLYEADRSDQRAASDYGIVLSRVETAMDEGDLKAKLEVQQESLRVLDEAFRVSPENVSLQIYRALVHLHRGEALTASGSTEEARRAYLESAAISEPALTLGHTSLVVLFMRANQRLALNAVARGRRAEALAFSRRVLEIGDSPPTDAASARVVPRARSAMGLTLAALADSPVRQSGDRDDARTWLRKALEGWQSAASDPTFAAPHRREMREVEEALTRLEGR